MQLLIALLITSVLALVQRFVGADPNALLQMREQVSRELEHARGMVERASAQLAAIDQIQALIDAGGGDNPAVGVPAIGTPSLKNAIVGILDEDPQQVWDREALLMELKRRGWGPGGSNPRNTYTSRLRDLEKEGRIRRLGRDDFTSLKNEGAFAM